MQCTEYVILCRRVESPYTTITLIGNHIYTILTCIFSISQTGLKFKFLFYFFSEPLGQVTLHLHQHLAMTDCFIIGIPDIQNFAVALENPTY